MVKQRQTLRNITNVLLTTVSILTIAIIMLVCSILTDLVPPM